MLRIEYFDKERFMRQLSASHGSVLLHLDNGKTCDLKKDTTARSMLQMMDTAPKKGFDLTVTDPADVTGFLRYMLEAGRTERVAGSVMPISYPNKCHSKCKAPVPVMPGRAFCSFYRKACAGGQSVVS